MEPADTSAVLQPVLQWGVSAAGGGNYWAIASWYLLLLSFSLSPSSPSPLTFSFLVLPSFSDFLFILCRLVSSIHPTIVSPLLTVESGDVIEGTFFHLLFPSLSSSLLFLFVFLGFPHHFFSLLILPPFIFRFQRVFIEWNVVYLRCCAKQEEHDHLLLIQTYSSLHYCVSFLYIYYIMLFSLS